ncbi:MAG: hypothetical protein QME41_02105 [Actinomycetota bacterium]|nr:hypothetical protein [Actinomycetota bacterium]
MIAKSQHIIEGSTRAAGSPAACMRPSRAASASAAVKAGGRS